MPVTGSYNIRRMRRDEVALAVDWAENEGWNPGRFDAESFFAADPEGFLIGELDGRIIAMISAVRYGSAFAFLGFYIVHPEFRGHGFGITIWHAACRFAGERITGLDGVLAQEENYRKSGFVRHYHHIRCRGVARNAPPATPNKIIVPATEIAFDALAGYDAAHFGAHREAFLRAWLRQTGSTGLTVRNAAGDVAGYGVLRPATQGWRIGPLFANTPETAEKLFETLVRHVPMGNEYFIDIPEINAEALALARRQRLEPCFQTVRMYANGTPALPTAEIYGATTLELG